jgi:hypothetical protein
MGDDKPRPGLPRPAQHIQMARMRQNGAAAVADRQRRRRGVTAVSGATAIAAVLLALLASCSASAGTAAGRPSPRATSASAGPTSTLPASAAPAAPASAAPAAPVSVPPGTALQAFEPWTPAGTLSPSVNVVGRISGTDCTMGSAFDVGNMYAWRCFQASGAFYDPCFAPPGQSNITQVACAASPWSGVTIMSLAQPLTRSSWGTPNPAKDRYPWATLLVNGQRCGKIDGTGQIFDDAVFNFSCASGYASFPDTATEPWTVSYAASRSSTAAAVEVATAWL